MTTTSTSLAQVDQHVPDGTDPNGAYASLRRTALEPLFLPGRITLESVR